MSMQILISTMGLWKNWMYKYNIFEEGNKYDEYDEYDETSSKHTKKIG